MCYDDIPEDAYAEPPIEETLKELLTDPKEIEFQKDEYDLIIDPEKLEIVEIIKDEPFEGVDFLVKINENETIKMHFSCWFYAATKYEPEDSGYEIYPIKED